MNLGYLSLKNIEPLNGLKNLIILKLSNNSQLSDISPLSSLVNLEKLVLGKTSVTNYKPVEGIKHLKIEIINW